MLAKHGSQLNKAWFNSASSPSNNVIRPILKRLSGLLSHARPAWVEIEGGSVMSSPVVLITGALTGIGRATALAFAKEGARVVVSGRHDEEGKKLVVEVRKLGAEAEFIRADVRHEEDVRKLIDKTVERFGRLDVAVNNAG